MTSDIALLQGYSRSASCTVGGGVGAVEHANWKKLVSKSSPAFGIISNKDVRI